MSNDAQLAGGYLCDINELCMRAKVPTYIDDKMIGPKARINVSEIRRIQHNHPVGKGQQDQEDNQAGNKEESYQPRVQQQEAQVQENQQALKF